MHLAAEANSLDVAPLHPGAAEQLPDGGDGRLPPVGGVLLRPERLRMQAGVFHRGRGEDLSPVGAEERLGSRGADVNADQIAHGLVLLSVRRFLQTAKTAKVAKEN